MVSEDGVMIESVEVTEASIAAAGTQALDAELKAVLESSQPNLPDAMRKIPRDRWASSQHRVEATENWLRKHPDFDATSFLEGYCDRHPRDDGPLIALALVYSAREDWGNANKFAARAMSINQLDLYAQEVAIRISDLSSQSSNRSSDTEQYLSTHFCPEPFTTIETSPDGLVYMCCPAWLPTPIGELDSPDVNSMWRGEVATELRKSILDGSYRYCSRLHCGRITGRALYERNSAKAQDIIRRWESAEEPPNPTNLILSHDTSCNLACPSCRNDFILANKERQQQLDAILDRMIVPLLKDAEQVKITGSGDPFASNHFRRLLNRVNKDEYPKLNIFLHTNGQLFNERAWSELGLKDLLGIVEISIDAASAETYAHVRRGGDFNRLKNNLEFIRDLREEKQFNWLVFSMVVQARNFEEIPDFARLGFQYGADRIVFYMIRNWGTFSESQFEAEFIGGSTHPRHEEFLRILNDPVLSDPRVHTGYLDS
jgi:organic radical activating enzyme